MKRRLFAVQIKFYADSFCSNKNLKQYARRILYKFAGMTRLDPLPSLDFDKDTEWRSYSKF